MSNPQPSDWIIGNNPERTCTLFVALALAMIILAVFAQVGKESTPEYQAAQQRQIAERDHAKANAITPARAAGKVVRSIEHLDGRTVLVKFEDGSVVTLRAGKYSMNVNED
jgi:hypothetical protein